MINTECPSGFRVAQLKFCHSNNATHCVYFKEHIVREKSSEKPPQRTLFVIGVPPFCSKEALKNIFSKYGNVEQVYVYKKPSQATQSVDKSMIYTKGSSIKGFKVAYVVFENFSGLDAALKMDCTQHLVISSENEKIATGLKKWNIEYNDSIPNVQELNTEVDTYMRAYDERVANLKEQPTSQDDDGWVTVVRKGRNPGFARKESVEQKIIAKERKKRSKKNLLNFYRFQIKESKMNHLMSLREKFEEDKKKIELLKEKRKFKLL